MWTMGVCDALSNTQTHSNLDVRFMIFFLTKYIVLIIE